ncbi:MAG: hypothetical protein NTY77_06230 [Elusimicrobia bacterium]|nr:hypothetical protein [Elusimicrobiota bacterium]
MLRSALLVLSVCSAVPLWAAGPETERALVEQGFGVAPALPPLHIQSAPPPHTRLPQIRSALDFSGVQWPAELTEADRIAFEVALNISGSFEGDDGWVNLTNDFDGQGLSLGLLNQCLGQGSLQPLLIAMRDRHMDQMSVVLSTAHLASLSGMLSQWQSSMTVQSASEPRLSWLDETAGPFQAQGFDPDQASVAWARANLYTDGGKSFDPVWKQELTALANNPEYVTLQINAALGYHAKAAAYESQVGVRQLRAYLMLFDVVVQNGGLYPDDLADYAAYVKANPHATSTQKLQKLLALRLRHVRAKYVADVRSRKGAIITGTGVVHGVKRDLPAEYVYDPLWVYR